MDTEDGARPVGSKKALRLAELSRQYGGSSRFWSDLIRSGSLPGHRLGHRTVVVFVDDLMKYFEQTRIQPTTTA